MHLVILIIGVTLFPKAYALRCVCERGSCIHGVPIPWILGIGKEIECPGSAQCAALIVVVTNVEQSTAVVNTMKNCMPPDLCNTGSVYFGNIKTYENIQCCSTALCNVNFTRHTISATGDSEFPSGKKCYTCTDPENCGNTQKTLTCIAEQDRCISVMEHNGDRNKTMIGCATQSMCGDAQYMLNMVMNISLSEDSTISCCEDDLCNSIKQMDPTSTTVNPTSPPNLAPRSISAVSLLFLVAPVMLASRSW